MKNTRSLSKRSSLLILPFLCFGLVATTYAIHAQDIDPAQCNKSADEAKKCISQFVDGLVKAKRANEDQVTLLKSRNLGTDKLKADYEDARQQVGIVVKLLTRNNPDFTSIKREFGTAQTKANTFYKEADTALNTTSGGGFGLGGSLVNWFFDNACKAVALVTSNPLATAGCNELIKYLRKLDLKHKANWRAWNKVPNRL
jgi:hypothetical protein